MELIIYYLIPLSIFLYLIKSIFHKQKFRKLPPGPVGFPIVGSLPHLGALPHESLFHLARRHGPLMTLRLGSVTTVVASSPEAAMEILGKHDETISDRTVPDVVTILPHPEFTLAWSPGDHAWRSRRRTCTTQMFTQQRLDSLQHLRGEQVRQLIRHIERNHCASGKPVDIGQVVFATTLNLISNTMFSINMVDPEFEKAQEFKDLVWQVMQDTGKPNLSDFFLVLRRFDLQGIKRRIKVSYQRIRDIFEDIIEKRLRDRDEASMRKGDFLDVLLDQCQHEASGLNRQNYIKTLTILMDLFIAGSDTSAITTEWAMAELLRKPSVLQKARQELYKVIGTERHVQESDFHRLPYLQAIVKETMRLHPPAPLLLPYKAKADAAVLGYVIPKGTQVLVNAWAIGRDPNYWTDPMEFRPERFLGSNVDYRGRDFEYIPFGAGRRICPGLPLATRMVQLMVASLLQSFDWRLPNGMLPDDLNMEEKFGVALKKAVSLWAIPTSG